MDRIQAGGRFVRIEALPIGIAPEEFTGPLERNAAVHKSLGDLRDRFKGRRILLAVDRLDYTKGIPERLRAFRRLLRKSTVPPWPGRPDPDRSPLARAASRAIASCGGR